jgi:phosphohistidine phosphatase
MKTLLLLRHAKSSWKDTSLSDFERPLNRRGRRAAALIGRFLKRKNVQPNFILSSPAVRARSTIEIALEVAQLNAELRYDERLYLASAADLLTIIRQFEDQCETIMLVGHNSGTEDLLHRLTGVQGVMPTAALAKIVIDVNKWSEVLIKLSGGRAELEWLVKPKELVPS